MTLLSNPSQLEVVNKVNELDTNKLNKLNNSEFTTYEGEIDIWKSTNSDVGGVGIFSQNDQYMLVVHNQAGAFTDASGEIGLSFMPGATALMGKAYDTEEHKHSLVIDLDGIKADDSLILTESSPVLKYIQQTLTDDQKAQARTNLGVESVDTSKFVTTDTDQQISGIKTFSNILFLNDKINIGYNNIVDSATDNSAVVVGWQCNAGRFSTAIGSNAYATGSYAIKIQGGGGNASGDYSIGIGVAAKAKEQNSIGIGHNAKSESQDAIQLGAGINSTAKTLQVWDYPLLDGNTGKIPDARLSDNIATVSDIPDVKQTTGTSTENVMSQDAVTKELTAITDELANKLSLTGGRITGSIRVINEINIGGNDAGKNNGFYFSGTPSQLYIKHRDTNNTEKVVAVFQPNAPVQLLSSDGQNIKVPIFENQLIGCVAAFASTTSPLGWLNCDGSAVSRTTYSNLFAVIGTTYGAGDGSTTFNLPNLIDKFVQGSAVAGTVKNAGLPNITGDFGAKTWKDDTLPTGVFVQTWYDNNVTPRGENKDRNTRVSFDASRSSSIYGKSTTVQPPALTMIYAIKY